MTFNVSNLDSVHSLVRNLPRREQIAFGKKGTLLKTTRMYAPRIKAGELV